MNETNLTKIPECSYCHKINLEKNKWDPIEKYKQIYDKYNSKKKISHGICPECAEKLEKDLGLSSD